MLTVTVIKASGVQTGLRLGKGETITKSKLIYTGILLIFGEQRVLANLKPIAFCESKSFMQ